MNKDLLTSLDTNLKGNTIVPQPPPKMKRDDYIEGSEKVKTLCEDKVQALSNDDVNADGNWTVIYVLS